ncbi:hypothetical protein ACWEO2_37690 [Nocardia sp. NPDC004278]
MASTRIGRHVKAPRATVYRLLLDADAVVRWQGWRIGLGKLAALAETGELP